MQRLIPFVGPAIVMIAAAILTHVIVLFSIPHVIMGAVFARTETAGAVNAMAHGPRADENFRAIIRPSPDLLYSICVFDLSEKPLHIQAPVPKDTYWSLSVFADNSDNFFAVNDRQVPLDIAELIVSAPGQRAKTDLPQVTSPSVKGLALVRVLVSDETKLEALEALRRQSTCAPFEAPAPAPG
ncbi:MAG: DUF1254 domain-containing protein [Alphaproteobacteria bacterium]|nr:DUF1254 domain-containing protein [Alphaproteobacteria bacterium]